MTLFFTADLHLFHKNIIKYQPNRGASIDAMHEQIVKSWNAKVNKDDTTYVLGDVCFASAKQHDMVADILRSMNGKKILVKGNHDHSPSNKPWGREFLGISDYLELNHEGKQIVLFHYPILHWNRADHGSYHLFGHVHARPGVATGRSMDVGVDTHPELAPYAFEEIDNLLKVKTVVRHHEERS